METAENTARMEKCPQFDSCSAQKCPLDEFIKERTSFADEPKCNANILTRLRLGKDLPHFGLIGSEWGGYMGVYGTPNAIKEALLREKPLCFNR